MQINNKILVVAILAGFALPFLALAAGLQLETIYPASPSAQQVITGHTKLPDIIRYAVSWTIIIAALVTAFSLIYAGVQYLTSVGRPNAVAAAKKRIGQCLLGLLIIASSYLVLQTINPQLTIMTIKKQQVGAGIVMFTQAGLYGSEKDNSSVPVAAANWCYTPAIAADSCTTGAKTPCYNPNMVNGFNTPDSDTLENLMKAGDARFLGYDIPNTTVEFGNMAWESASKTVVNFTKFPLYAIGFWGDAKTQGGGLITNTKIFAYPNTQYNIAPPKAGRAIEYTMEGKIGIDGTISNASANDGRASCKAATVGSAANDFAMKFITIRDDFAANFKSTVTYYDKILYDFDPNNPGQPIRGEKDHPPLSIKMQGKGSGVILYSQTSGGSQTFAASAEDFNLSNVKFDNLADQIELRNFDSNGSKTNDFLAILHSGYYFIGDLRLFLEEYGLADSAKNEPPLQIPLLYSSPGCASRMQGKKVGIWDHIKPYITGSFELKCDNDVVYSGGSFCIDPAKQQNCNLGEAFDLDEKEYYYPTGGFDAYGNIPKTTITTANGKTTVAFSKINIALHDRFGYLGRSDKSSSLQLFELYRKQGSYYGDSGEIYSDKAKKQGEPVCREVKLCTSKGYLGDCLVYVPNLPDFIRQRYSGERYDTYLLPMAPMVPVPIPWGLNDNVKTYDQDDQPIIKAKEAQFADKIKSIDIKGDCLVVLFENGISDMAKCLQCKGPIGSYANNNLPVESPECKGCWDGGGPGANSEVFTKSVNDLTTHSISKCGGREKFGFGDRKNCASAIAIFPLKKAEE